MDNREEWLASLKARDQVVVTNGTVAMEDLGEVAKRTPSGQIVLTNGNRFDKHGHEIGAAGWNRLTLFEVTPEKREKIKHNTLANNVHTAISRLDNINRLRSLSNERLEELLATLNKDK